MTILSPFIVKDYINNNVIIFSICIDNMPCIMKIFDLQDEKWRTIYEIFNEKKRNNDYRNNSILSYFGDFGHKLFKYFF